MESGLLRLNPRHVRAFGQAGDAEAVAVTVKEVAEGIKAGRIGEFTPFGVQLEPAVAW